MKQHMKKFLSMLLTAMLVLSAASAQGETPWMNSNVLGAVTADTAIRLQDDFYVSVNKDWLASAVIAEGNMSAGVAQDRRNEVRAQIIALLSGEEQTSRAGRLAQTLYRSYVDTDARDAQGMSPVQPYLTAIEEIKTMEDLTAYLLRQDVPYNTIYRGRVQADSMDSAHNAVYVGGCSLLLWDADEYKSMTAVGQDTKTAMVTMLNKLLVHAGYNKDKARGMVEACFEIEGAMAQTAYGSSDTKQADYYTRTYHPVTMAELETISPAFPIAELLQDYAERGVERFILTNPDQLAAVNALYTEENLEKFKAFLLCRTLEAVAYSLDTTCIKLQDEAYSTMYGVEYHSVLADYAYDTCSDYMGMVIGRMYVESYVPPEIKQDVTEIINAVVAVYRKRLEKADWLGEATRAKAIEKLDSLTIRSVYPDDWSLYDDFADVTLKTAEEGGSLLANTLALSAHEYRETLNTLTDEINREKWPETPQTMSASYLPEDNSINILAGYLGGGNYDPEDSRTENLARIGVVIGHEITHAFDPSGSQFDKDGNMSSWWTEADRAAFTERTAKVENFFNAIEVLPEQYVDGQLTIGETVADLGGMSAVLEIASADPDFDYQTFFAAYAHLWQMVYPASVIAYALRDEHPLSYVRVNAVVQQFQPFYDAFDVQEGDGMYLAPEARLSVW